MPEPRLPARLNKKFAALGVVGAVMVLLPMAQLLRYQDAEIHSLQVRRAALDPMADAVQVQRGLIAHASLAAAVLQGRTPLEPERRQRQAEVNQRLDALGQSLTAGDWGLALAEASDLATDWALLAQQVGQRSISATQSEQAHRLRVEQALQIMDLLTLAAAPGDAGAALLALRDVPRLAWLLSVPGGSDGAPSAAQAAARLDRARAALRAALPAQPDTELEQALQQAAQATSRWRGKVDGEAAPDADADARAVLQAHWVLWSAAQAHTGQTLRQHEQGARNLRKALLLAMTALCTLGLGLLLAIARLANVAPARRLPAPRHAGHSEPAASLGETGLLMHRLRRTHLQPQARDGAVRQDEGQSSPDAQPTLPPPG